MNETDWECECEICEEERNAKRAHARLLEAARDVVLSFTEIDPDSGLDVRFLNALRRLAEACGFTASRSDSASESPQ